MMKLSIKHIEDLRSQRFIEKTLEDEKGIIDTHTMGGNMIFAHYGKDEDISDIVSMLNASYHNRIISGVFGDWIIDYALSLKRINYRMGW